MNLDMTSEIDKLKHFDALNYKGEYSTIKIQDDSKVTFLCKYNKNKHIQPCNYYPLVRYLCLGIDCRAAYSIPKRKR